MKASIHMGFFYAFKNPYFLFIQHDFHLSPLKFLTSSETVSEQDTSQKLMPA
jgi:hypothetical protein